MLAMLPVTSMMSFSFCVQDATAIKPISTALFRNRFIVYLIFIVIFLKEYHSSVSGLPCPCLLFLLHLQTTRSILSFLFCIPLLYRAFCSILLLSRRPHCLRLNPVAGSGLWPA